MGEILIDEPELIIDDPAGDCMDYWTALVKEDKTNNNILQTEQTVQVNLFEKNTGHKKQPKEKKNELRKKIKNILRNSTFPPEQIRKAIEGYAQDPSFMDMRIDQVDPSSIFLYDVCSENFSTAFEFERKGMLQPIEDVELDWQTFQDCKEMNLLSKHQDDFEPREEDDDDEEVLRRKSCRTERYESPVKSKGRQESAKSRYQDRRQDEQAKENNREKERDRDRERRNTPEKKRLVKLKDQKDDARDHYKEVNQEEEDLFKRKEIKSSQDNEKEKFRHTRKTSREDRDQSKEQSRDKEKDRSRENISRKRSSSQERRRENYASRRDEDRSRRFERKEDQELTRSYKALRPYDNQAQRENQNYGENGYQGRMNRNYNENQRNTIIDVDEKESRDNTQRNYHDENRTNKVTVIDGENLREHCNSSKYGNYNNGKPRQFDPDRRKNYQQEENPFNNNQFQAKPTNDMGQTFMQMVAQMVANQISSNPNMANMMGQFISGSNNVNRGGYFPNRYQQKPYFNNNNKRYQNNYNNDRGSFQRKPFYSGNDENDRRRKRSNSHERNKSEKRNDNNNRYEEITEVTRRRNY